MNIYQKLIEVRKAVPYLKKDNKGYKFEYVSSSQALGVLRSKMDEMGLLLQPSVKAKTVSDHTTKNGGHEYFTELEMDFTWINAEKPEEQVICGWYGQGLDSGEKGTGKALTYAEKYFLLKFFNIATDKDDPDSFQKKMEDKKPKPAPQKKPVENIKVYIDGFCKPVDGKFADKSTLTDSWNTYVEPILGQYSEAEQNDITATYNETIEFLKEKAGE